MTALSRLVDTDTFRKFATGTTGTAIRSTDLYKRVDMRRRSVLSRTAAAKSAGSLDTLETAVFFIGHVKSGGSLTGAILDSHAAAIVSDEIDIMKYVDAGFDRTQLIQLMRRGALREAEKGRVTARRLESYSLAIAESSQGTSKSPLVVGDTRAGPMTRVLASGDALDRLFAAFAPLDVRFVHVVRHPLEPIAAMVRRSGRDPRNAMDDYFEQCERLADLRLRLADRCVTQHYEDLVAQPTQTLEHLCRHLNLPTTPQFLTGASNLVDSSLPAESTRTHGSLPAVEELRDRAEPFDFLGRYRE